MDYPFPPYMAGIATRRAEQQQRRWDMEQLRRQVSALVRSPNDAHRILEDIAAATKRPDKAFSEALTAFVAEWFPSNGAWRPEIVEKPYSAPLELSQAEKQAVNARAAGGF